MSSTTQTTLEICTMKYEIEAVNTSKYLFET